MSINYDALVAGNCFGDINLTSSIRRMSASPSAVIESKPMVNLVEDFGLPLSDLFNLARRFLKGQPWPRAQRAHLFHLPRKTRGSIAPHHLQRQSPFRCSVQTG